MRLPYCWSQPAHSVVKMGHKKLLCTEARWIVIRLIVSQVLNVVYLAFITLMQAMMYLIKAYLINPDNFFMSHHKFHSVFRTKELHLNRVQHTWKSQSLMEMTLALSILTVPVSQAKFPMERAVFGQNTAPPSNPAPRRFETCLIVLTFAVV